MLLRKIAEALQIDEAETQNVRFARAVWRGVTFLAVCLIGPARVQLLEAVAVVIDEAIFEGQGPHEIVASFPADFHKSLKQLIAAIITKNMPAWRETVNATEVRLGSMPFVISTVHALASWAARSMGRSLSLRTAHSSAHSFCLLLWRHQISLPRLVETDWRVDVKTSSDRVARMSAPAVLVELTVQQPPERADIMPPTRHVAFEMNKETLDTMLDGLRRIRDQLASVTNAPSS